MPTAIEEILEKARGLSASEREQVSAAFRVNLKIPGADYQAEQNSDGTWNIFGVRSYATHVRKLPGGLDENGKMTVKEIKVERAFLENVIDWHAFKREKEDFLYPLHVNHHPYLVGGSQPVYGAGFIMPRDIITEELDGKKEDVLLTDLLAVKPEIFMQMDDNRLPYVSAEFLNINEPKMSSLSLMEHDVPFFAFRMLTIGQKTPWNPTPTEMAPQNLALAMQAAVAYSRRFFPMTTPATPKKNSQSTPVLSPRMQAAAAAYEAEKKKDEEERHAAADESGDGGNGDEGGEKEPTLKDVMGAINRLAASMEAKAQAAQKATGGPAPAKPEAPPAATSTNADGKPADQAQAAQAASLEAKVDTANAKVEALIKKDTIKELAKSKATELAAYNLGIDIEAKLAKIATEKGESAMLAYVQSIKDNGTAIPPHKVPGGSANGGAPGGAYPEAVLAFSKHGQDALAAAASAYQMFEEGQAAGLIRKDRKAVDYIMGQIGLEPAAAGK